MALAEVRLPSGVGWVQCRKCVYVADCVGEARATILDPAIHEVKVCQMNIGAGRLDHHLLIATGVVNEPLERLPRVFSDGPPQLSTWRTSGSVSSHRRRRRD